MAAVPVHVLQAESLHARLHRVGLAEITIRAEYRGGATHVRKAGPRVEACPVRNVPRRFPQADGERGEERDPRAVPGDDHLEHLAALVLRVVVLQSHIHLVLDITRRLLVHFVAVIVPPLHHAAVPPPHRDHELVVVGELAASDVRAVPLEPQIIRARNVGRVPKQLDETEVVHRAKYGLVLRSIAGVDVCAVRVLGPYSLHRPSQSARVSGPLGVPHGCREFDLLA
mmetsp:Transcript_56787/g.179563  ORF Transcript_56787/g.179563 Transcript_56787/m.179563 type:complete len:227 (+) Transcript_56787:438-1118(+)